MQSDAPAPDQINRHWREERRHACEGSALGHVFSTYYHSYVIVVAICGVTFPSRLEKGNEQHGMCHKARGLYNEHRMTRDMETKYEKEQEIGRNSNALGRASNLQCVHDGSSAPQECKYYATGLKHLRNTHTRVASCSKLRQKS